MIKSSEESHDKNLNVYPSLVHFKKEGAPMHPDDYFVDNGEWHPGGAAWDKQLKAYEDCFCQCPEKCPIHQLEIAVSA